MNLRCVTHGELAPCPQCRGLPFYYCAQCKAPVGPTGGCATCNAKPSSSTIPDVGRKDDDGKAPWHLVPWRELSSVVDVIAYGAKKYGEWNWQGVELSRDRYFAALSRHLVAWRMGERVDPESGLPHLAHVACNALFLAWHDRREETSR